MPDLVNIAVFHPTSVSNTLMSTPVVGLYGATSAQLRGPYGAANFIVDQSKRCQCRPAPTCYNSGVAGPGECMRKIMLEEVIATVKTALKQ